MPQANVMRWRDGNGWLVLSGSGDYRAGEDDGVEDIEAQAIERAIAGKPIAYIFAAGDIDAAEDHLRSLEDLGAPTGYLVDVLGEDDETLLRQLGEAGVIIIGDGKQLEQLRSGLVGAAMEGIAVAFDDGAIILAEGAGAQVLGGILTATKDAKPGMGWVENVAIMPAFDGEPAKQRLRDLLLTHPNAYGLGIGTGSALVLGPDGEVEAWGKRQITVLIGSNFK